MNSLALGLSLMLGDRDLDVFTLHLGCVIALLLQLDIALVARDHVNLGRVDHVADFLLCSCALLAVLIVTLFVVLCVALFVVFGVALPIIFSVALFIVFGVAFLVGHVDTLHLWNGVGLGDLLKFALLLLFLVALLLGNCVALLTVDIAHLEIEKKDHKINRDRKKTKYSAIFWEHISFRDMKDLYYRQTS